MRVVTVHIQVTTISVDRGEISASSGVSITVVVAIGVGTVHVMHGLVGVVWWGRAAVGVAGETVHVVHSGSFLGELCFILLVGGLGAFVA